jgi:hypothetical protein
MKQTGVFRTNQCTITCNFVNNGGLVSGGKRMTDGNGEAADNGVTADVAKLASAVSAITFAGELCKDPSANFEDEAHQIPELCWDVFFEKKRVVTHASGMASLP